MSNFNEKKYLDLEGLKYFWDKIFEDYISKDQSDIRTIANYLSFLQSVGSGTSLNNININTRLHIVELSSNSNLQLSGVPAKGYDIHIMVKANNNVVITMPGNGNSDVLICDQSYELMAGEYLEINIISDGSKRYYRVAEPTRTV